MKRYTFSNDRHIDGAPLTDDLMVAHPEWRGTKRPDGSHVNPLVRVEWTNDEVRVFADESVDPAEVARLVRAHDPTAPTKTTKAKVAHDAALATVREKAATDPAFAALLTVMRL